MKLAAWLAKSVAFAVTTSTILATLLVVPTSVSAASNARSSEGYLPQDMAMVNQSFVSTSADSASGTEVVLGVNLFKMQHTSTSAVDYEYGIVVDASANTRRGIGYDLLTGQMAPCTQSTWYSDLPGMGSKTFNSAPDNEGVWVSFPNLIWFYGFWYNRVFVTENGFLTFDTRAYPDNGGKYTNPVPPQTLPSANDGRADSIVAPYWTGLAGGTVKWGIDYDPRWFVIVWLGPKDAAGHSEYFAVHFLQTHSFDSVVYTDIKFSYCSVSLASPGPRVGIENQLGNLGVNDPYSPASNNFHYYTSGTTAAPSPKTVLTTITHINILATKRTNHDGVSYPNDESASISVGNATVPYLYPGGVNVYVVNSAPVYTDPTRVDYTGAYLAAAHIVVGAAALIPGPIGGAATAIDLAWTGYDLWQGLHQTSSHITINNVTGSYPTANVDSQAKHELVPDYFSPAIQNEVWDIASAPAFRWDLSKPKDNLYKNWTHYLDIKALVHIKQYSNGGYTEKDVPVNPVTIALRPYVTPSGVVQGLTWLGRSNPSGHTYNFRPLQGVELPVGATEGYHVDSAGSGIDTGYSIMGWSQVTPEAGSDYQLDSRGRMVVSGKFRQNDILPTSLWAQSRSLNLYVIGSYHVISNQGANDLMSNIVKTIQILGPLDGTGWIDRSVSVDLGAAYANTRVKVGIGRFNNQAADYQLAAEWANVVVNDKFLNIYPSGSSGSTSVAGTYFYSSGSYYYFHPGTTATLTATAASGFVFHCWYINWPSTNPSCASTLNPYSFTVTENANVSASFYATLTIGSSSYGYTTPGSGPNQYPYGARVTVTATAYAGYRFGYWTLDGVTSLGSSINVLMDKSHTLTPTFINSNQRVLKIWVNDASKGTTDPVAGIYVYANTASVSVTATATYGNVFSYWLLDPGPTGTRQSSNPFTIIMTDDHELDAYFDYGGGGGGGGCCTPEACCI